MAEPQIYKLWNILDEATQTTLRSMHLSGLRNSLHCSADLLSVLFNAFLAKDEEQRWPVPLDFLFFGWHTDAVSVPPWFLVPPWKGGHPGASVKTRHGYFFLSGD